VAEQNLILLGPPGAGKGTQAQRLVDDFGLPYYATGDILRLAVKEETDVGKEAKEYMDEGNLVPDELICRVIMERVDSSEADDGFILDGFPRTIPQAEVLENALERRSRHLTAALLVEAPDEEVIRRLSGRRICTKNSHLYHVDFDPPKHEGVCDQDGSRLIQREDDKPETIRARLDQQLASLGQVVDHYDEAGLLRVVDGVQPIEAVTEDLLAAIADGSPTGSGKVG